MQEDFELETVLSLVTGYNFTNDFDKVFDLVQFIFEDPFIDILGFNILKEAAIKHIFYLYPELQNISKDYIDFDTLLNEVKSIYGDEITISVIGEKVIKLKHSI